MYVHVDTSEIIVNMDRLFEEKDHAKLYSKYRPTFPNILFKTIMDYHGSDSPRDIAVDVGCGSGQSTLSLVPYFKRVIGVDVSAEQIAAAQSEATGTVEFINGPAEELSCVDMETVDLITAANAFHWFNRDTFYKEVSRVLKPGGTLAIYGYGIPILDNSDAQVFVEETLTSRRMSDMIVWHKGLKCLPLISYTSVCRLPLKAHNRTLWPMLICDDHALVIEKHMSVDDFIGYLASLSFWRLLLQEHPGSRLLDQLRSRLLEFYSKEADDLCVRWPLFLITARKEADHVIQ